MKYLFFRLRGSLSQIRFKDNAGVIAVAIFWGAIIVWVIAHSDAPSSRNLNSKPIPRAQAAKFY